MASALAVAQGWPQAAPPWAGTAEGGSYLCSAEAKEFRRMDSSRRSVKGTLSSAQHSKNLIEYVYEYMFTYLLIWFLCFAFNNYVLISDYSVFPIIP